MLLFSIAVGLLVAVVVATAGIRWKVRQASHDLNLAKLYDNITLAEGGRVSTNRAQVYEVIGCLGRYLRGVGCIERAATMRAIATRASA
jgi:hypothetical protein